MTAEQIVARLYSQFGPGRAEAVGLIESALDEERNLRIVAEENLRMMTENARSLRAYIDSRTTPRQGIEPQYDQSDVDAYYLSEENRALREALRGIRDVAETESPVTPFSQCVSSRARAALEGKL